MSNQDCCWSRKGQCQYCETCAYEAQRRDGTIERVDPTEQVTFTSEGWFHDDVTPEAARQRAGADGLRT
jgi:hypothetical protein